MNEARKVDHLAFSWIPGPFTTDTLTKSHAMDTMLQGNQSGNHGSKAVEVDLASRITIPHCNRLCLIMKNARKVEHLASTWILGLIITVTSPQSH